MTGVVLAKLDGFPVPLTSMGFRRHAYDGGIRHISWTAEFHEQSEAESESELDPDPGRVAGCFQEICQCFLTFAQRDPNKRFVLVIWSEENGFITGAFGLHLFHGGETYLSYTVYGGICNVFWLKWPCLLQPVLIFMQLNYYLLGTTRLVLLCPLTVCDARVRSLQCSLQCRTAVQSLCNAAAAPTLGAGLLQQTKSPAEFVALVRNASLAFARAHLGNGSDSGGPAASPGGASPAANGTNSAAAARRQLSALLSDLIGEQFGSAFGATLDPAALNPANVATAADSSASDSVTIIAPSLVGILAGLIQEVVAILAAIEAPIEVIMPVCSTFPCRWHATSSIHGGGLTPFLRAFPCSTA